LKVEVVRLQPGDDLRVSLEKLGVKAGCVVSGIGSLHRAVLRFAAVEEGTVIEGPLEVVSLAGTLSVDGVHLHASVSDAKGRVWGGHLMHGCVVRTTAEVIVGLLEGWELRREQDAATGFHELVARRPDYDYP
jgi:uncharacterized protein